MQGAILRSVNKPLEIRADIDLPELNDNLVHVKLHYAGVCHSQVMEARGLRGQDKYLPHFLGHEGSGTVVKIGRKVNKVKPGQRVILSWIKGEGEGVSSVQYNCNDFTINAGAVTTFNEYALVAENRVTPLPKDVPLDVAVLFGCAILTGAGIVMNRIKPEDGNSIAIFGLGGVGLSALMATKLFDCRQVIAIDKQKHKLALALDFGATDVIEYKDAQTVLSQVMELSNNKGVDYSIEATGKVEGIELGFQAVRKFGGLCVFASHPPYGSRIQIDPFDLISGKRIEGSWGGSSFPDRDIPRIAALYREGKLPLEKLLGKRYPLKKINEALVDLEKGHTTRPLIEIDPVK